MIGARSALEWLIGSGFRVRSERVQRQVQTRRQCAGLQVAGGRRQVQWLAGLRCQALGFFQQPAADAALAGELAHAQVRQAPDAVATLQHGGAEQAIVEAPGDQAAVGQRRLDQRFGTGIGG